MYGKNQMTDIYLPQPAEIISNTQNSPSIFTLKSRFIDSKHHPTTFLPGQFNMLYLYGIGEVAISISSDESEKSYLSHTIRAVGRTTKALQRLQSGDEIGIRGPFGNGWPIERAQMQDIIVITGGLGCAPTVSLINYILARRKQYGALKILQGVKHSDDLIFKKQYAKWQQHDDTEVYIAANLAGPHWPWGVGHITDMLQPLTLDPNRTIAMLCGPKMMMHVAVDALINKGVPETSIYLSMERNMACGIGHCGHCQYGGLFVCKDGPVFAYPTIKPLFGEKGF